MSYNRKLDSCGDCEITTELADALTTLMLDLGDGTLEYRTLEYWIQQYSSLGYWTLEYWRLGYWTPQY